MKVKELIEKLNKISDPEAYVIMFLTKKNSLILSKSDSLLKEKLRKIMALFGYIENSMPTE
jgi:hypothetical protein